MKRIASTVMATILVGLGAAQAALAQTPPLITAIQLTAEAHGSYPARPAPAFLCRGEVVEVAVTTQHPNIPGNRVSVAINGVPGDRRYLQFRGEPGKRRITIAAQSEDGLAEAATRVIDIDACEVTDVPRLYSRQNPYHPNRVGLVLPDGVIPGPDFAGYYWDFGDGANTFSEEAFVSHDYSESLDGTVPFRTFVVQLATQPFVNGQASPGSLVRRATATVGDSYFFSKQRGLLQPPVIHDPVMERRGGQLAGFYSIRNLENEHIVFQHVTREDLACDPAAGSARGAVLPSEVIFQGGLDLEDPAVTESPSYQLSLDIKDSIGWLPADAQVIPPVYDPDSQPMPATGQTSAVRAGANVAAKSSGGSGATNPPVFPSIPPPPGAESGFMVLPAGHTHEGFITLDAAAFDVSVCNVAFHMVGETTKGERVYASLYYELKDNPFLSGELDDPDFALFLSQLLDLNLVPDLTRITDEDLYRLTQEGKIRRTPAGWEVI